MSYKINDICDQAEYERHHRKEAHYLEQLARRDLLIQMDNIAVDAEQLVLRTFQCNTDYCVKCTGSGSSKEYKGSCCTDLQVDITENEKDKLHELALMARKKLRFAKGDPLPKIVDAVLRDAFTEESDEQELYFKHRENESCVMSWMENGTFRCGINTLCERLGVDLTEFKPGPCFLFPLHYGEYGRQKYILSVLSEETRGWIEQHPVVGKLKCLKTPEPGSPPAYVFLRGEIEFLLGKPFYKKLDALAQPILEEFMAQESVSGAS